MFPLICHVIWEEIRVNVGDLAFYQIGFLTIFYISLAFFLMTSRYEKY